MYHDVSCIYAIRNMLLLSVVNLMKISPIIYPSMCWSDGCNIFLIYAIYSQIVMWWMLDSWTCAMESYIMTIIYELMSCFISKERKQLIWTWTLQWFYTTIDVLVAQQFRTRLTHSMSCIISHSHNLELHVIHNNLELHLSSVQPKHYNS
jgi:hypothetical protein